MTSARTDIQRLQRYDIETREYPLAIITDKDRGSRVELDNGLPAWESTLRRDRLHRETDSDTGRARYSLRSATEQDAEEEQLVSLLAEAGRGAEFSELVMYGNRLLTFDDRTGLVCEIRKHRQLVPRQILMTGSGDEEFKGFKSEWASVWGDQLVVGSHGKKRAEQWVKILDPNYGVISVDWSERYRLIAEALGVGSNGYVVHEAAEWHPYRRQWLFFPRKVSQQAFDKARDEREAGSNQLVIASEDFSDIQVLSVGECVPERGMSSFKIVPGRPEECVGLKSVEVGERTETYLFCFNLSGEVLQEDVFVGNYKCEGIEIL